jgi:ribosomal protein S18 acetylase RimI-like enzyme
MNVYFGNYRIRKDICCDGTNYWLFKKFGKKVIGLVKYRNEDVIDLWVNREFRRKGLARKLMEELIKDYGHGYLSLLADGDDEVTNAQLRCFYRSLGFISDKSRHNFMRREG